MAEVNPAPIASMQGTKAYEWGGGSGVLFLFDYFESGIRWQASLSSCCRPATILFAVTDRLTG